MSSFDLKRQERMHPLFGGSDDVESLVMTVPRDQVPVLLQGRVPLYMWMDTFDKVIERYQFTSKSFSPVMLIPCLLPCFMPVMISKSRQSKKAWLQLVQEQAEIYRKVGVQVSLAKELCGVGSSKSYRTVGLHFDIGPAPSTSNGAGAPQRMTHTPGATVVHAEPVMSTTPVIPSMFRAPGNNQGNQTTGGRTLTSELTQLANLHNTGAITDAEYQQAKSRLLKQ